MSRISILGAGAWGTALAISLARRGGPEITLWAHSVALAEDLIESGENLPYLPGFTVPMDIQITPDLPGASMMIPPLTTVRQPCLDIGRQLARMAIEKAKHVSVRQPETVVQTELILRGTTWPFVA